MAAPAPPSLSRGVFPARSWGLRGSGEELLLRRPDRLVAAVRTLPRGVVDRPPMISRRGGPATAGELGAGRAQRAKAGHSPHGVPGPRAVWPPACGTPA